MAQTRIPKEQLDTELVYKIGTPVNNQVGVWTGDGSLEGDADFTWDGSALSIAGSQTITVADGANVVGLTIQQNDATNDKLALEVNAKGSGAAKVTSPTLVQFNDTNGSNSDWSFNVAGGGYPQINFQATGGTLAAPTTTSSSTLGLLASYFYDNSNVQNLGSKLFTSLEDFTLGSEDVSLQIQLMRQGTLRATAVLGYFNENFFYGDGFYIVGTDDGTFGTYLYLQSQSPTPAANDTVSQILFMGRDSGGGSNNYAVIKANIIDPTATSEDGKFVFNVITAGTNADELELTGASLYPTTNDGLALGTTSLMWSDLFLASGGVINFNNGNATLTHSTGLITSNVPLSLGTSNALTAGTIELGAASDTTLSRSAAGVLAVEGVVIPSISSTNTLTNKRITPRRGSTTSSATPTINTDSFDIYSLTAQTVDITSFTTNLSGTPDHGQRLLIEVTGTATRAITWGASFEASTIALPTTTVSTAMLSVAFIWNSATSKWRCVGSV